MNRSSAMQTRRLMAGVLAAASVLTAEAAIITIRLTQSVKIDDTLEVDGFGVDLFLAYVVILFLVCASLLIVLGLPSHFLLQRLKANSFSAYAACGAAWGYLIAHLGDFIAAQYSESPLTLLFVSNGALAASIFQAFVQDRQNYSLFALSLPKGRLPLTSKVT